MVKFVREMRDELHQRLAVWRDIIPVWEIDLRHRSDTVREAVRATYRFVSFNFPQTHDWLCPPGRGDGLRCRCGGVRGRMREPRRVAHVVRRGRLGDRKRVV